MLLAKTDDAKKHQNVQLSCKISKIFQGIAPQIPNLIQTGEGHPHQTPPLGTSHLRASLVHLYAPSFAPKLNLGRHHSR